jgi:hypothetical protein
MKNIEEGVEQGFYQTCSQILESKHDYKRWFGRPPNRWNNRSPGNGRHEGIGIIRLYAEDFIHVSIRSPIKLNKVFNNIEDVYDCLRKL